MPGPDQRRLVVNADDFGLSAAANAAIIRAHREGILTTASLMVNEPGFEEAVSLARAHPRLGVGLHLTLVCGRAASDPGVIPGLADAAGQFSNRPVAAGLRYFFRRSLAPQLAREIAAQFEKFRRTGLVLDHLNGHLHIHLHPTVFRLLTQAGAEFGFRHFRLTRDRFGLSGQLARGRWIYRACHAVIFNWLSGRVQESLQQQGIRHPDCTYGLLQDGRVDEAYLLKLLPVLPAGAAELYAHPGQFSAELAALTSPHVRELVSKLGIRLIRYQDL